MANHFHYRCLLFFCTCVLLILQLRSSPQAFRRDPGHPQWHHSAFQDVRDTIRADVRRMLHSRAEVPFHVPLEVNIVLVGFNGEGGYRFKLDAIRLEELLKSSFPVYRPSCLETGELLDIEHHLIYNVYHVGQPDVLALEKAVKEAMISAGHARESEYGRELPTFEVDAATVEPSFEKIYSNIFGIGHEQHSFESDKPFPGVIFVVNFDKARLDPRNKDIDFEHLMHERIQMLTQEELKKQEGEYIYRYHYNGGGSTQVWLAAGRFLVIDLSAGPCSYGKIETEEGSVSYRTLPRLSSFFFPKGYAASSGVKFSNDLFMGQLAAVVATTIEHVIAPDLRFETLDHSSRILIPIIVLQNHNRYNILSAGHNYSIDVSLIEKEMKKMILAGQEVVVVGGSHALHRHEKLAIAVSKAMRSHSLHETKNDGRFHVHTKTYLDGAILKEEMEHSTDVLAAGLLEVANPSLSSQFYLRQHWANNEGGSGDSVLKHSPPWASYNRRQRKQDKTFSRKGNQGNLYRTYGTRVIPVFVLSLADVDRHLLMEDESLVWTSKDVVIVLQHDGESVPLSYVSETERRHAVPSLAQRHILAGLASAVGGLSAPYERASHVHERPILNWLLAAGCHPFGPFSNTSCISQLLHDVALRTMVYARVDSTLRSIRETSEAVQAFASQYLRTPLGEPVKGKKKKAKAELWIEKFYKKTTNLPEPFPHELVERLEQYLDHLEEQLVDLSSSLYDHRLDDAHWNSSEILQSAIYTQQYVDRVLASEKDKMRCCNIEYKAPVESKQAIVYGGILVAGFLVYFLVIFFSSPIR